MPYPSICLVTACYNHEKYIRQTIESVLNQQYPNLQYVVINDGSTDRSGEILQKYAKDLYYYEDWPGYRPSVTLALNRGFEKTNAEIMGWLNSKNILLPGCLRTIADIFSEHQAVEWVTGLATTLDGTGKLLNTRPLRKNLYDYLSGDWSVIQQESTFWRRSLWQRTGGKLSNQKDLILFDVELWSRFFGQAELYHLDTVLGAYRWTPNALSVRNRDKLKQIGGVIIQKMRQRVNAHPRIRQQARLYTFLKRYGRDFLGAIPHRAWQRLPILQNFHYKTLTYNQKQEKWIVGRRNPFRDTF